MAVVNREHRFDLDCCISNLGFVRSIDRRRWNRVKLRQSMIGMIERLMLLINLTFQFLRQQSLKMKLLLLFFVVNLTAFFNILRVFSIGYILTLQVGLLRWMLAFE
ncbi:hypothetical protein L1987_00922 [Smallanthus sonchifolius]|uniref:Uncharacterized protein n=1 Tax=Smallanthus sonchifolius TaxID=185202 RepID=A0ACB9K3N5_9ASTR|nr:hypothetical protein L1987_00922 [Smallanthus sonchifolius]